MTCVIRKYFYQTGQPFLNIDIYNFTKTEKWLINAPFKGIESNNIEPVWKIVNPDALTQIFSFYDPPLKDKEARKGYTRYYQGIVNFLSDDKLPVYGSLYYNFEPQIVPFEQKILKNFGETDLPINYFSNYFMTYCGGNSYGDCPIIEYIIRQQLPNTIIYMSLYNLVTYPTVWFAYLYERRQDQRIDHGFYKLDKDINIVKVINNNDNVPSGYCFYIDFDYFGGKESGGALIKPGSVEEYFNSAPTSGQEFSDFVESSVPDKFGAELCCSKSLFNTFKQTINFKSKSNLITFLIILFIFILIFFFIFFSKRV